MRDIIYKKFEDSGIKIKSKEALNRYISFCLDNNEEKRNKGFNASHHILPQAMNLPFQEYSNLNINHWNESYLSYYNHFYAHWLLTEAVSHISVHSAFIAMNNRDKVYKNIDVSELANKYSKVLKDSKKLEKDFMNEIILFEGLELSRYEISNIKMLRTRLKNNSYKSGGKKASNTVLTEFTDNEGNITTIAKEISKKSKETQNKIFTNEKGEKTSILMQSASATRKNRSKMYTDENGNLTNNYIETNRKTSKKRSEKYGRFNIFNINSEKPLYENLTLKEVKDISQNLPNKTKENYLGKFGSVATNYKKNNQEYKIGLYSIKI